MDTSGWLDPGSDLAACAAGLAVLGTGGRQAHPATQCAGTISHHEEEDTSWGIDTAYGPNDARSY